MLFNSFGFIFLFLPVTLLGYFLLLRLRLAIAAKCWLLGASLFFYGWWNVGYLPLMLGSILFNYAMGGALTDYRAEGGRRLAKRNIFLCAVAANIALLGYFKYLDFFIGNANLLTQRSLPLLHIVLPLGISFFTITQIAFLVDAYEGLIEERNLLNYALFVTFFPHLLAGPILHHKEMMPQFERMRNKVVNWKNLYLGLALFSLGLFKKVVVADQFSIWANAGFGSPEPLNLIAAWLASYSYTFQLYFDFSGYSDMAVGIGWLFNVELPVNFNSPYKAKNIIDFWKRWHISLTNFITTYLYTPILRSFGRITFAASLGAVFLSMLISGLWHGAGWTFIVWGGMHGAALGVNHLWRRKKLVMPAWLGWLLTFHFVSLSFVFFRAGSWQGALRMLRGMAGVNGVMLHQSLAKIAVLQRLGVHFGPWLSGINGNDNTYLLVAVALLVVAKADNSQQIVARSRPNWGWCVGLAALLICSLIDMGKVSEFLYFQF